MTDRFDMFLKNEAKNKWHKRALTDRSYKKIYQHKYGRILEDRRVNT